MKLLNAGNLAPPAGVDGIVDPAELLDVLFDVTYRLGP